MAISDVTDAMRSQECGTKTLVRAPEPTSFAESAREIGTDLRRMWDFTPGERPFWVIKKRLASTIKRSVGFPRFAVVKPATPTPRNWTVYFIYAPDGEITGHHAFTLARLREQGFALLVVVCGLLQTDAEARLGPLVDALIWKEQRGFDFSAYTLGLRHLAKRTPGTDAVFLNDSVLGPFADLNVMVERARWRLTGFTASGYWGNHIQSYAFIFKDIDRKLARDMMAVFNPFWAFDKFEDVVICQELPMARLAAQRMSVGSLWYQDLNPSVRYAQELLEDGFPFIKKSLFGKNAHWHEPGVAAALLARQGYTHDPAH